MIDFEGDFADLFEVRGMRRAARGSLQKEVVGKNKVILRYKGVDNKVRETALTFDPEPTELKTTSAKYSLKLPPSVPWRQFVTVSCDGRTRPAAPSFLRGLLQARRDLVGKPHDIVTIETSNAVVNEIVCRSLADLRMLMTATPEGKYPYAGIPWYSTTFGRDGLITAMQTLWFDASVARGCCNGSLISRPKPSTKPPMHSPARSCTRCGPGKWRHSGEVPFGLYYGSIDSTPLFILLAGLYVERTGDVEFLRQIWPNIVRGLDWIKTHGDCDGDGLSNMRARRTRGLQTRAGRIRTMPFSMPMASLPKDRSLSLKSRAISTRRCFLQRNAPACLASQTGQMTSSRRPNG